MAYLNRTTEQWQEIDSAHHLHPFTDYKSLAKEGSNIIVKADGVYLTNTDNQQFLDAMIMEGYDLGINSYGGKLGKIR